MRLNCILSALLTVTILVSYGSAIIPTKNIDYNSYKGTDFSLQYPEDWEVSLDNLTDMIVYLFSGAYGSVKITRFSSPQSSSLDTYLKKYNSELKSEGYQIVSTKSQRVGGKDARKITYKGTSETGEVIEYTEYILYNNKIPFHILFTMRTGSDQLDPKIADKITGSIKFQSIVKQTPAKTKTPIIYLTIPGPADPKTFESPGITPTTTSQYYMVIPGQNEMGPIVSTSPVSTVQTGSSPDEELIRMLWKPESWEYDSLTGISFDPLTNTYWKYDSVKKTFVCETNGWILTGLNYYDPKTGQYIDPKTGLVIPDIIETVNPTSAGVGNSGSSYLGSESIVIGGSGISLGNGLISISI